MKINSKIIYAELYDEKGCKITQNTELFVPPKYYEWEKPHITAALKDRKMRILSDVFAKSVCLDFEHRDYCFSDNFFDIADKDGKEITFDGSLSGLKIKSVFDIDK